jgi:fructose-1,6-bisphosphatase I
VAAASVAAIGTSRAGKVAHGIASPTSSSSPPPSSPPDRSFPHFWVRRKDGMWTVKPRQQRRQKRQQQPRPAPPTTPPTKEITLSGHLSDAVRADPDLDDLADIVSAIRDGCVEISDMIGRASLDGHTGYLHDDGGGDNGGESETTNVQGERQKKLDVMGNDALKDALRRCGKVSYAISEEDEREIVFPPSSDTRRGREYVVAFDPLDGSSNVDSGIPVGTIFGVYEKRKGTEGISSGDIVAAGYCFYSSATSFVFSFGKGNDGGGDGGVHGFTLDRRDGEFKMTHPDIRIPSRGSVVSFNEANRDGWDRPMREYVSSVQAGAGETGKRYSSRYVGSMVGDVHRTLLSGGVFGYPADDRNPDGKLRLLYEAAPMAFLVEEAGGTAAPGRTRSTPDRLASWAAGTTWRRSGTTTGRAKIWRRQSACPSASTSTWPSWKPSCRGKTVGGKAD